MEVIADTISKDIHKALELKLQSRDTRISQLEKTVRHLHDMVDAHEQYWMCNCLIVHCIPESRHKMVIEAAKQHLGLTIISESIEHSHWIGPHLDKFDQPWAGPLIVKFVDLNTRASYM